MKVAGFGLITFLITFLHFLIWPKLLPKTFRDEQWTVGKEILHIISNILLIAIVNRYYLLLLTNGYIGLPNLGSMILVTFLIGIFPTAGSVIVNYIVQLKKYSQAAAQLPVHTHTPDSLAQAVDIPNLTNNTSAALTLTAENEKDTVIVANSADLLFVESSDNYCTVYYLKSGQPAKVLLRSSLSRIESQLMLTDAVRQTFVRCHRSYIINLDQVERVTGNAQGYKLHLLHGQYQVPVARKYNDTLVAELKGIV